MAPNPATESVIDRKAREQRESPRGAPPTVLPDAPDPATEPHECPYCDGRGWNTIAVHDPTDPDGEPLPEQEQCATCGGSGEVSRPASEPEGT